MRQYSQYEYRLSDEHIATVNYVVLASMVVATTVLGILVATGA